MPYNPGMEPKGVSRRDFLKIATLSMTAMAFRKWPLIITEEENLLSSEALSWESALNGSEIEKRILADEIPVLEYHYPGYSDKWVALPKDFFESQIKYLRDGGYRTVSDKEFASFLEASNTVLPAKTVVLRIDQGSAHFDEFEKMIEVLKTNRFSAMVFVTTGEQFSDDQWQKLADWQRDGDIYLGSHSVTHPDFRKIDLKTAQAEAVSSKQKIEEKMAGFGVKTEVISFAFPSDSVPDNISFLKSAGYKFCLGGNLFGVKNNSAKPGLYLVPSLYPYASRELLEITKANAQNNPLAYTLSGGHTFDDMIRQNTTPVTVQKIKEVLKLKETYPEISFGKIRELLTTKEQKEVLIRPTGIIIHTDDQAGDDFERWNTDKTYIGLESRETDVHFSVGVDGVAQFLKMYKDFCMFTRGARGFGNYISIEMCGRDYNLYFDDETSLGKKKIIELITERTVSLVERLMEQYDISPDNVLGHYQASASGKSDPGKNYMENLFLPFLEYDIFRNKQASIRS